MVAPAKPPGGTTKANGPEKDPYDVDGDGKISKEEYDKIPMNEQDQYEPDGNGGYKKKQHTM
jgi:hypothetical protein